MVRNSDRTVVPPDSGTYAGCQPTLLNEFLETPNLIAIVALKNAPHSLIDQAATILARRLEYTDNAEVEALNRYNHNLKQHAEELAALKNEIAAHKEELAELQNTARFLDRTLQAAQSFLDKIGIPRTAIAATPIGNYPVTMTLTERIVELLEQLTPYKMRFDFLNDQKKSPRWRCEVDERGVLVFDVPAQAGSGLTYESLEKAVDAAMYNYVRKRGLISVFINGPRD